MKNRSGFTMMELLVVIAIMAILSAVAVPNLIGWRQNQEFASSVRRTLSVLHSAKMHAVKENIPTVVSFDMDNQNFSAFVDRSSPVNNAWDPDTDSLIDFYEMPPGILMANSTFTNHRIRFDGRGMPNNLGIIELTNDRGSSNTVSVNITGRIRIE